jgi:hypothetical protein
MEIISVRYAYSSALKRRSPAADEHAMPRTVSIFSLVAALAVAGYLFTAQSRTTSSQRSEAKQAESQGIAAAATIDFQQAAAALEQHRAETGSYAGADLAGYGGVFLARGDAATYCMQLGVDGHAFHEAGPNGAVASGPC